MMNLGWNIWCWKSFTILKLHRYYFVIEIIKLAGLSLDLHAFCAQAVSSLKLLVVDHTFYLIQKGFMKKEPICIGKL